MLLPARGSLNAVDVQDELMAESTRRAQQWGGFALGCVFALIGVGLAVANGWTSTAVVLLVGGLLIALAQTIWILVTLRRGRGDRRTQ